MGEIPDWDPAALDFVTPREAYNWNAAFVFLTMAVCRDALRRAGLEVTAENGPRTACLVGSPSHEKERLKKVNANVRA